MIATSDAPTSPSPNPREEPSDQGPSVLSLQEAADAIGVHYMTAYRHVRSGKLRAQRANGRWQVTASDLETFKNPPVPVADPNPATWAAFEKVLIAGDDIEAWRIASDELIRRDSILAVHANLLTPAMQSIGARWADGDLRISDEHRATATATRIAARLSTKDRIPGRKRGAVIVGAVQGDSHSMPCAILADIARAERLQPWDLGANTPAEAFCDAIEDADRPRAVAISVSVSDSDPRVKATIKQIRKCADSIPVFVGGPGIRDLEHAQSLGADDTAEAIEDVRALFQNL